MSKFIHISDLHLGAQLEHTSLSGELKKERIASTWNTFEKVIDYAITHSINVILISGDLIDQDHFYETDKGRLIQILAKDPSLYFYIIKGNHDYKAYALFEEVDRMPNVHVFHTNKLSSVKNQALGIEVHAVSWTSDLVMDPLPKLVDLHPPFRHIFMFHGDIGNQKSDPYRIGRDWIANQTFDYYAFGHIHQYIRLQSNAFYAGILEPHDFGDGGEHGFILGDLERAHYRFIPFSRRNFNIQKVWFEGSEEWLAIFNAVEDVLVEEDFNRIHLQGRCLYPEEELINVLKQRFCDIYYIEYELDLETFYPLEFLKEEYKGTVIADFIRNVEESNQSKELVERAIQLGVQALLQEDAHVD